MGRRSSSSDLSDMDYTRLTLRERRIALDDIARETASDFGGIDASQLNWRRGSLVDIGQCFEQLLAANALTLRAAERALSNAPALDLAAGVHCSWRCSVLPSFALRHRDDA